MRNLLTDNRHGLIVAAHLRAATGTAEREAAVEMMNGHGGRGVTLGADKAYDTRGLVKQLRAQGVTPQVAQNTNRLGGSAIDERTTRHAGYGISQRKRKLIEECFGWIKTVGLFRQTRHRGAARVGWCFTFLGAAYNLVRMRRLLAPPVYAANA